MTTKANQAGLWRIQYDRRDWIPRHNSFFDLALRFSMAIQWQLYRVSHRAGCISEGLRNSSMPLRIIGFAVLRSEKGIDGKLSTSSGFWVCVVESLYRTHCPRLVWRYQETTIWWGHWVSANSWYEGMVKRLIFPVNNGYYSWHDSEDRIRDWVVLEGGSSFLTKWTLMSSENTPGKWLLHTYATIKRTCIAEMNLLLVLENPRYSDWSTRWPLLRKSFGSLLSLPSFLIRPFPFTSSELLYFFVFNFTFLSICWQKFTWLHWRPTKWGGTFYPSPSHINLLSYYLLTNHIFRFRSIQISWPYISAWSIASPD